MGTAMAVPAWSRLRLLTVAAATTLVCCAITLANAGAASAAEPTLYTAIQTIPVPPASNFAGSGGGDGWAVALSGTQEFNVFHHQTTLQVICHNQSDASVCFGPDTITDSSGDNFATSGHPGMYYDPNTGKLWVYATRTSDDTAGVVCIDTTQPASNTDPYCGFVALTPAGGAPTTPGYGISGLSNPVLYGDHFYAFNYVDGVAGAVGTENTMLCFDTSTDQPCQGQPYTVSLGTGLASVGAFPTPSISLIGSQVIVPINVNNADELGCLNAANNGNCGGSWPLPLGSIGYVGNFGPPFPLTDSSGNITGLCLPDGDDACYTLAGASTTTPSGMGSVVGSTSVWNGPALTLGPRVYVPNGNNDEVECYDYSASAGCTNFPKTFENLGLLYTVNPDPQRPTCIWVNSDNGSEQIQNFDAYTGGACGQGPVRALASQFVLCTPTSYSFLKILSPTPGQYNGGTVTFDDGDGNPIPGLSPASIDSTGTVNLAGLNLNTATGLPQFLIALNNTSGTPSAITLELAWVAPYDPSCINSHISATNPAITAQGTSISATAGQSFTKTVATFTDPDTTAKPTDYSASINWGDGSTSVGTITGTPSQFTISGTHTYAKAGSYVVTVSIIDNDGSGNNATVTDPATVAAKSTATAAAVKAKRIKRGTARLSGVPAACVRHAVSARVTGTQIASVAFALDGRRMHTRTVHSGRTYRATFAVSDGGHRLTVVVRFKKSSRTASRRFARIVSACALPKFTG